MEEPKNYLGFVLHISQKTFDEIVEKCKEIGKTLDDVYDEFSYHFEMKKYLLPRDYETYLNAHISNFLETGKVK